MATAKLSGSWVHDGIEGDVSGWLKAENVGIVHRGIMWAAGYGKGRVHLHLLLHEGTVYNQTESDEFNKFRYKFQLDGEKHDIIFSEGAPFIPLRSFSVEGHLLDDGVIEATLCRKDGTVHSKTRRYVNEDCSRLFTDVLLYSEGKEIAMKLIHKRNEEVKLSLTDCLTWCPNVLIDDDNVPENMGEGKTAVVSGSLGEYFADAHEVLDHIAKGSKKHEQAGDDKFTLEEISVSEFQLVLTKVSGEVQIFAHTYDRDASTLEVKFTEPNKNKQHGTWHVRVLQSPLRVQCWESVNDKYVSLVASMTELQNMLDRAIKCKRG